MKCPNVSNFVGYIELRQANIGIGIFFAIVPLLGFLYRCLEENLNSAEVRLEAIPVCVVLTIRGYFLYGVSNKKAAPMVPQLLFSLLEIFALLGVPFILAFKYNINFAGMKHGYYSTMTEEIAHELSVYSFVAYVYAMVHSYLWIVQYSYYKLLKDVSEVKNEDRKFGFSSITA
ncbi:uncharacterized protein LOC129568894 [Sitodiplosis mosellana]|uniref:uncharacterized protein LOC129568894 n=1 Tax=Sitodiplosis mosellana TaxID=263140 RepID=UPI0024451B50|nr:uncharacterized protein LOC129568894 [Sitodiplosis mosellana]